MSDPVAAAESKAIIKVRRPDNSQRFPSIHLPRALERVRELYKIAANHEVPVPTAGTAWGYSEKSSGVALTVSALKYFGLIDDIGNNEARKIKISDMALKIIRDPREISSDRDTLIRQAALTPPIHREIIEKYSGMPPSDEALKAHLLLDRGFKDEAVNDFVREFTATMAFAKISDSANIQEIGSELEQKSEMAQNNMQQSANSQSPLPPMPATPPAATPPLAQPAVGVLGAETPGESVSRGPDRPACSEACSLCARLCRLVRRAPLADLCAVGLLLRLRAAAVDLYLRPHHRKAAIALATSSRACCYPARLLARLLFTSAGRQVGLVLRTSPRPDRTARRRCRSGIGGGLPHVELADRPALSRMARWRVR